MGTILTVHGTGSSGPEEGTKWWQKGSAFETHLHELVTALGGKFRYCPVIWDGKNSESSRRTAATKLAAQIAKLEQAKEPYVIIGHSHGGSVIANALLLTGSNSNPLPHLVRVITIATPFIQSKKAFWLFSRSGLIGKSVLVSIVAFVFLTGAYYLYSWSSFLQWTSPQGSNTLAKAIYVLYVLYIIAPFCIAYCLLWFVNHQKFFMYRAKILRFSQKEYGPRLVSLYDNNDEAINGLKSLKNLHIRIFQPDFATSTFLFASIFILPLLLIAIAATQPGLEALLGLEIPKEYNFLSRFGVLENYIVYLTTNIIHSLIPTVPLASPIRPPSSAGMYLTFVVAPMFSLVLVSLAVTFVVSITSRYMSSILSVCLNRLARRQIRRAGFGNDTIGEVSIDADSSCPWLGSAWLPLPDQLSDEIVDFCDRAASVAVLKFRDLIKQLALSREEEAKGFFFSEYLTWNELIHTSYFNIPRFRMLVAYAIANSEGFGPSMAFKNHPDYEMVACWFIQMKPKGTVV